MIKLLIADDEPLILEDMADFDWYSVGIDKVFTAKNGEDAYNLALTEKPEIILTDIEMPKLNGIELTEKLSDDLPETKFIFLTAYDNFNYAQAAVTNHILAYILKPFDEDELLTAVKKAADMVKAERAKTSYNDYLAKQLDRSRHFLMGYFFDALQGGKEDIGNLIQILNINQPTAYYTAIIVTLPHTQTEKTFAGNYQIFVELNQLFVPEDAAVLSFFHTTHLVYFVAGDTPFAPTQTQSVILTLANTAKEYLDKNQIADYLITIGTSVCGIGNCEAAYRSAFNAISYSFYLGFNTIICIEDVEPSNSVGYFQAIQDEQFFNFVKAGNFEGARSLLHQTFRSFSENRLAVNEVQHICHSILVRLALCLLQCGQNPDFLFNKTNALDVIRRYNSINDLEAFMIDTIDVVTSNIATNHSQRDRKLITSIKEYISANPKTSLTDVAEHFHHSSCYLSHIFPKETGNTIKNYIIEQRVAYAKDLLKNSDKSIGQISGEVGYKTQQHFSNIFSKATGMTPSDYRRLAVKSE